MHGDRKRKLQHFDGLGLYEPGFISGLGLHVVSVQDTKFGV